MFGSLTMHWRLARSHGLRREVVDALDRLFQAPAIVQAQAMVAFMTGLASLERDVGHLGNVPNKAKQKIAKGIARIARRTIQGDLGGGYGLFLVSALVEATTLPGEDAEAALEMLLKYKKQAEAIARASSPK